MKKILLGLLFAGLASTALATTVTFSTNNAVFGCGSIVSGCSFTNGTTTSSLTVGDLTLTYTANTASPDLAPPPTSVVNYGNIIATCALQSCGFTDFSTATLLITVAQSAPYADSSSAWSGTITGGIGSTSSSAEILFVPQSFQYSSGFSTVTYALQQSPTGYGLSFVDDQRATSIQGSVGLVNSPEPGSMILISSGLIGIGLFARRRARR